MWSINDVLARNCGISSPSKPGKPLLSSFLPEDCSKHALVDSWWVSGADKQYNECNLLKFEIWDRSHLFLIILPFWVSISSCSFQDNLITVFSCFSQKKMRTLMKNQNDLVLRYVLVILSRFEKNFQTTKSKLTIEKANYNEL